MRRRLFDPNLVSGLTPHRDLVRMRIVAEEGPAALRRIQQEEAVRFWDQQVRLAETALERCQDEENRARCRRNLDWARGQLDQINGRPAMAAE